MSVVAAMRGTPITPEVKAEVLDFTVLKKNQEDQKFECIEEITSPTPKYETYGYPNYQLADNDDDCPFGC